jgi:hypothetical protein
VEQDGPPLKLVVLDVGRILLMMRINLRQPRAASVALPALLRTLLCTYIVHSTATARHSMSWCINRGLKSLSVILDELYDDKGACLCSIFLYAFKPSLSPIFTVKAIFERWSALRETK